LRLFNEPDGRARLKESGVDPDLVDRLDLLGISSIANLLTAIKTARFFELGPKDMLFTVATDSLELYGSRLEEERELHGPYSATAAAVDHERYLLGAGIDHVLELGYWDRKRLHNLKYFTWVEQQGKTVEELDAQWYDDDYWTTHFHAWEEWDERITEFNERTGLLERYR
jgi:cysteine synthase A